jgi:hypothetical protein
MSNTKDECCGTNAASDGTGLAEFLMQWERQVLRLKEAN